LLSLERWGKILFTIKQPVILAITQHAASIDEALPVNFLWVGNNGGNLSRSKRSRARRGRPNARENG
jgi:hypothetical protein